MPGYHWHKSGIQNDSKHRSALKTGAERLVKVWTVFGQHFLNRVYLDFIWLAPTTVEFWTMVSPSSIFHELLLFFLKKINSKLHTFQMYKKSNSSLLCNLPMKMKELFPVN